MLKKIVDGVEVECTPEEEEKILARWENNLIIAKSIEYKVLRAAAYPSIADQLDMIYHDGVDLWKEKIEEIKKTYPKPV